MVIPQWSHLPWWQWQCHVGMFQTDTTLWNTGSDVTAQGSSGSCGQTLGCMMQQFKVLWCVRITVRDRWGRKPHPHSTVTLSHTPVWDSDSPPPDDGIKSHTAAPLTSLRLDLRLPFNKTNHLIELKITTVLNPPVLFVLLDFIYRQSSDYHVAIATFWVVTLSFL